MDLGRLISLLLCVALLACPAVCRSGQCARCPSEQIKTDACPHCQTDQNGGSETPSPAPVPPKPRKPCDLGNCLCAGAVTNNAGLDLQLGHVLGVFATVDALVERTSPAMLSSNHHEIAATQHLDISLGGRSLRLRIESLLI